MTDAAHVDAIDMLARANKRSVQEVEICMEELAHLKAHARIQTYLVVLTVSVSLMCCAMRASVSCRRLPRHDWRNRLRRQQSPHSRTEKSF